MLQKIISWCHRNKRDYRMRYDSSDKVTIEITADVWHRQEIIDFLTEESIEWLDSSFDVLIIVQNVPYIKDLQKPEGKEEQLVLTIGQRSYLGDTQNTISGSVVELRDMVMDAQEEYLDAEVLSQYTEAVVEEAIRYVLKEKSFQDFVDANTYVQIAYVEEGCV